MLSHSTKGVLQSILMDKVEATGIAKELYPELKLDGELPVRCSPCTGGCFLRHRASGRQGKCTDVPGSGCR